MVTQNIITYLCKQLHIWNLQSLWTSNLNHISVVLNSYSYKFQICCEFSFITFEFPVSILYPFRHCETFHSCQAGVQTKTFHFSNWTCCLLHSYSLIPITVPFSCAVVPLFTFSYDFLFCYTSQTVYKFFLWSFLLPAIITF